MIFFQVFKKFTGRLKEQEALAWLIKVSIWFFSLFLVYTVGFYIIERVSVEEAFWQSWQTLTTVGYGNRPAETTTGRWFTMLLSTLGIAVLGALFSAIFDYRQHIVEKKRLGLMKNPFKDGYVIFNFPGEYQMVNFLRELRSVEENVGICIVDNKIEELPQRVAVLPNIHFVKGNTLSKSTYEQAAIKDNKAVIIFPIEPNVPDSDGATKTVVDLVFRFVQGSSVRILHLLVDPSNAWMFEDTKSTQVLESFELFAIVQECQDIYSAGIIERLMLNTKGANPKSFQPDRVVGMTWGEMSEKILAVSKTTGIRCNPFALIRNGQPDACPKLDTIIEKSDYISVIAFNGFSWKEFEDKM